MEHWFILTPWYSLLAWTFIYLSDYWFTIEVVRMYRTNPHFEFEGSQTRHFEQNMDALKPISTRHIMLLLLTNIVLFGLWWFFNAIHFLSGYVFFLGMFILMEAGVHLRHLRSYFMLAQNRARGGLDGKLSYRRWFVFGNSAFDFLCLAILFLFTALITSSIFFLGGALSSLALALNHAWRSRKFYQQAAIAADPQEH
jgi:hypothetical protein